MSLLNKTKSLLPKGRGSIWGGWMEGKRAFLPGEACHGPSDSVTPAGRRGWHGRSQQRP